MRTKSPPDLSQCCLTGFRDSAQLPISNITSLVEFPARNKCPTSLVLSTQSYSPAGLTATCFPLGFFSLLQLSSKAAQR